ncbi:MAG: hypothetical protein R3188_03235 [Acidiferrobacterales bacterium]|nr:hypothetical protein [Acidiferrobacterales bacterium]
MMKTKNHLRTLLLAGLLVGSSMAYADDDLDVTMRMVQPGTENPGSVMRVIPLPSQASGTAQTHAQQGLDTANAAQQGIELPQIQLPDHVTLPEPAQGKGRH